MIRKLGHAAIGAALVITSLGASAGDVECLETVTHLIVHSSGNVYFTTDTTCPANWCQLNNASSNGVKNSLALIMEAQATGKKLVFAWTGISSCNQANATYASPDYIYSTQ